VTPLSRPSDSPCSILNAEASALAAHAEVMLLRKLLDRCDSYLALVAQEARIEGEPDACAESLRRDIALVLSG